MTKFVSMLIAVVLFLTFATFFNFFAIWLWSLVIDWYWNGHVVAAYAVATLDHVKVLVFALGLQGLFALVVGPSLTAVSNKIDACTKRDDAKSVWTSLGSLYSSMILYPLCVWLSLYISTWWFAV